MRFAAALAGNPEVLFLDEPTVGMDVESRELFWKEIRFLVDGGTTVMFATHYLAEAERYANRVLILNQGMLVADGSPSELRELYKPERVIELSSPEPDRLRSLTLPGLISLEVKGNRVSIRSSDTDATMRAIHRSDLVVQDVTLNSSDLEDVFLQIAHSDEGG